MGKRIKKSEIAYTKKCLGELIMDQEKLIADLNVKLMVVNDIIGFQEERAQREAAERNGDDEAWNKIGLFLGSLPQEFRFRLTDKCSLLEDTYSKSSEVFMAMDNPMVEIFVDGRQLDPEQSLVEEGLKDKTNVTFLLRPRWTDQKLGQRAYFHDKAEKEVLELVKWHRLEKKKQEKRKARIKMSVHEAARRVKHTAVPRGGRLGQ